MFVGQKQWPFSLQNALLLLQIKSENESFLLDARGTELNSFACFQISSPNSPTMAGFALFSLPPILLEKVITKVTLSLLRFISKEMFQIDSKGYFRLQQTCHSVGEFIRQCGNISVRLFGYDYYAQIDKSQVYSLRLKHGASIHLDWLYGIKMPIFRFYHTPMVSAQEFITLMDDHFVPFCDSLRTNRITCQELWFFGDGWTAEHCATLLTVLKPGQVYISSDRSDRYKALFHRKGLVSIWGLTPRRARFWDVSGVCTRISGITLTTSKIQRPSWRGHQDNSNEPGYSSNGRTKKSPEAQT